MERDEDLLKDINYCGYWDETKKYVIEIDKHSATKLMARLISIGQFKKGALLHDGLLDYFNADEIVITAFPRSRNED